MQEAQLAQLEKLYVGLKILEIIKLSELFVYMIFSIYRVHQAKMELLDSLVLLEILLVALFNQMLHSKKSWTNPVTCVVMVQYTCISVSLGNIRKGWSSWYTWNKRRKGENIVLKLVQM